jgi:hypothetical protein
MAERFVSLTPRIGAKVSMRREEVLDPANADECMAALERYGVLVFPRMSTGTNGRSATSSSGTTTA